MTTGTKIAKLRKDNNVTQESLAELLGVSRQSISKWESDIAYPETEKLIKISEYFGCSLDYLLKDSMETDKEIIKEKTVYQSLLPKFEFEYESKAHIKSLPLVHIYIGKKKCAKGVVAIGLRAKGIFSIGLLSLGVFSLGILSLGIISIGVLALGLLIGAGTIAFGFLALGAIAIGIVAIGAISIGEFAVGAIAVGNYFAYGDRAYGEVALASTFAKGGTYEFCSNIKNSVVGYDKELVDAGLAKVVPGIFDFIRKIIISAL